MRRSRRLLCSAVLTFLGCLPLASTEIPIDGRVRDSGGVGLAGVRVELRAILSRYEQGSRELDGLAVEPAARTVTGADGRFELFAPGEGMWEVGVFAEGFVPQRFRMTPLTGPETLLPVKLRRDAGLRVRVEGPDGRPLAGARVVGRGSRREEPGWEPVPRIATSGADGVARLPASRGESLLLLATAPGFPVQEGPKPRGPAEVSFRLAAGTPRRVEAPEGAILRDLQTSLVLGRALGQETVEVMTRGEPWLLLETAGGVRVRFAVKGGPVEVPALAPLPGRVIDTATRRPIAGAWVWPSNDPGRFVRTDEQGAYSIPADDLEIAAAGHLPEILDRSIPWPEGGLPPIALDPEAVLAGTVVDGEGRPAAGAEVAVIAQGDAWFPASSVRRAARVGRASALGEVRVSGLRPGLGHHLVAAGPGFAPVWLKVESLKAREGRFRLVLSRGRVVAGRIEDRQGRPVADAEVEIVPSLGEVPLGAPDDAAEAGRLATTGAGGVFAFADVPPGWYDMTVRRPGAVAQRLPRFEVRQGDGTAELGSLRLDEEEVLTARAVDPEGRPVAGAEVWVGVGEMPAAVTGPDGSFALRASRWQVLYMTVCEPGFVPLGLSLPQFFPEETLTLTLRPGASVSGRMTGADGLPASRSYASVNLIGDAGNLAPHECDGERWSETDEAGRFRIAGLEPGLYRVDYRERMAFAAGEAREVDLRSWTKTAGASLSGRLAGRDGLPVPGATVTLHVRENHGNYYTDMSAISRTDADGNYRLTFSKPGLAIDASSYGVTRHGRSLVLSGFTSEWKGPEVLPKEGRVDLTLDRLPEPLEAASEVELRKEAGAPGPVATLTGRILGLAPEELARAKVTASRGKNYPWTAGTVDTQGVYRLEGLERDEWRIRVEAADRALFETVHIPAEEARITRDLLFEAVAEISGQVETSSGEPVAGAAVRLRRDAEPFQVRRPDAEARTRSDGSFEIRLPHGTYDVTASREGFIPPLEAPGDVVTVDEGRTRHVYLFLQPAVALRGRLSGLPPDENDVEIEATLADGTPGYKKPVKGKMEAEGRYVIPGLGPGTWEVVATYEIFGTGERKATGRVVVPEEATEAGLDLAFSQNTD